MSSEPYLLPNGRVLRYSFRERLVHWLAGFSYVYLLLTGLAFWSPWLFWIAVILGGPTISRELHPWFGLALRHRGIADVPHVASADEGDTCRQGLVGLHRTLHSQRRRSDSIRRPLQPWPEVVILGLLLERPRASAFRVDSVVARSTFPGICVSSVSPPCSYIPCARSLPSRFLSFTSIWALRWSGVLWLRHSRRRVTCLGQPSPPHVVPATPSQLG